ncbi:MAG: beta-ketoacyl synthase, partial [Elusimicrobia bacterium]|nr:beta-ketoacyl synthase [Elusimicrobiota bacterium]
MNNEKIAIIGIGIIAPDASNKDEFWQNVKTGKSSISEVPKDRWDTKLYYDADKTAIDKTYSKIGGFIKDFEFDPIKYRIPPQSAKQISRLQKMTVEASRMAFEDSGYDKKPFDRTKTAVSIGNAMGAMRKEMTDFRVYKYHSEDLLKKTKGFSALSKAEQNKILSQYEELLDEGIVSINEDTMPGELSNVTAGRVSNIFDLNGPNMTFDAACASSLAALDYAVLGLRAGKFDMAVCGGADEMMSPPAYVKFCKIGALSEDGSWVFDERANGFVMGEAIAVYILKRYTDAIRDNDKIYALINAVGTSSDGKGKGITAPNPSGQKLAIKNTFDQVDYLPCDIQLIEAHGTATKAGDASELKVLKELFAEFSMPKNSVSLGSIKSQIGHTKAAAGAVSMVKTILALHNKILPPSINFKNPNKTVDLTDSPIRVITKAEEWKTDKIRRANVSSFGFGGTNFHVALEEYRPGKSAAFTKESASEKLSIMPVEVKEDAATPFSVLQGEAVTFSAPTGLALVNQMQSLKDSTISKWGEPHPIAPFAIPSNEREKEGYGISIVSKSSADLQSKIDLFAKSFRDDVFTNPPLTFKLKGMYPFKKAELKTKIGFLFPGQGSQYVDMMRDLAAKYKVVQ